MWRETEDSIDLSKFLDLFLDEKEVSWVSGGVNLVYYV